MQNFYPSMAIMAGAAKRDPIFRHGLSESLQEFATRIGVEPEQARACWALQGLRALHAVPLEETWEATVQRLSDSLRIAPGLAVPTGKAQL